MTRSAFDLVRAIVFGLDEHARPSAPEPEILGDLAPVLSPNELQPAFAIVLLSGALRNTERHRIAGHLVARATELGVDLPEEAQRLLRDSELPPRSQEDIGRTLEDIDQLPGRFLADFVAEVGPQLDSAGLATVLDAVERHEAEPGVFGTAVDARSECVATLAPILPPDLYGRLLEISATLPDDLNGNRAREAVRQAAGRGSVPEPGKGLIDTPAALRGLWMQIAPADRLVLLHELEISLSRRDLGGAPPPEEAMVEVEEEMADGEEATDVYVETRPEETTGQAWVDDLEEAAPPDFEEEEATAPAEAYEPEEDWLEEAPRPEGAREDTGVFLPEALDRGPKAMPPPASAPPSAGGPPRGGGRRWWRREPTGPQPPAQDSEEPVVNTGFAPESRPAKPVEPSEPLRPSGHYWFWFEVGTPKAGRIDLDRVPVPADKLPPKARLTVALFAFDREIAIDRKLDVGEIELLSDGSAKVVRPAASPALPATCELARTRLFFPVTVPDHPGRFRLRCNLYFRGLLVQSHLVTMEVARSPGRVAALLTGSLWRKRPRALQTECDYTLSHSLRGAHLHEAEPHRLSVMLNDNGDGTHGFRVYGEDGTARFKQDAAFSDLELQDFIDHARGALRRAAWGSEDQWANQPYRYDTGPDPERLRADLARLARWGYRFYDAIANRLAASGSTDPIEIADRRDELAKLMLSTGSVQLASKQSARQVVPVALLYDYGIDDTQKLDRYSLCPEFVAALDEGRAVTGTRCFNGDCPSRGKPLVVCPSGFWGYRHRVGLPVSIGGRVRDTPFRIPLTGGPELSMAVATDTNFVLRASHERAVQGLRAGLRWRHADNRDAAIELMRLGTSHVIYFYCHGGVADNVPYIEIGRGRDSAITRALLSMRHILFRTVQPLVFINGCHTTALEPESALDLVTYFVESANAAGVLGTEITVFEPLACGFAEPCLRRYLSGVSIGEAVRLARLDLLQQANPLGLVYVPYVVASLTLVSDGN